MFKYFVRGLIYGIMIWATFTFVVSSEMDWPKGLMIAALIGLVAGGCDLLINRLIAPKKASSN